MCCEAKRLAKLALGPVLILLAMVSAGAHAAGDKINEVNMSPGVTAVGQNIYNLHMIIFWICVIIGVLVFGVMFYSIYYTLFIGNIPFAEKSRSKENTFEEG